MRNFSKNFTEKDGFEGNFKVDLSLQKADEHDTRDKAIDLGTLTDVFSKKPAADTSSPDTTPKK